MTRPPQPLTADQAQKLQHGFALLQAGRAGDAHNLARAVAAQASKNPDAHHLVALCSEALGEDGDAEKAFRKALKFAPAHPHVLSNFANWLNKKGRAKEALTSYRKAVEAAPNFDQAWLNMGIAALDAGDLDLALSAIDRALELQPRSSSAWHALGNIRRGQNKLSEAETAFRRAVALEPGNIKAWINLGIVLRLLGRPAEALTCLDEARRRGDASPTLSNARVGVLVDLGELNVAYEELTRLIGSSPHFAQAYATRAHILWEYGDLIEPDADPLAAFRAAVASQPDNDPLRFELVRFLLHAKRADEALELIQNRKNEERGHAGLAMAKAHALINLGRLEEAGALFDKLEKSDSRRSVVFLNAYTNYLLRAGRWDEAAIKAEQATRIEQRNQEAWCNLGTAWRLIGDPREAWLCDYDRIIALVEVEPPEGYADTETFLTALKTTLEPMHKARREPVNQSLRKGSQTPGRLFGRPDPVIERTRQAILRAVERHIAALPDDETHPFLNRKMRSILFTGSWSVKLWTSGRHADHFHPEGWMSSAFYVSLPPSVCSEIAGRNPHAGWIQFGQPQADLGLDLPPRRVIQPKAGHVALFPSYIWHGTVPFEDDDPRVTIAFDMLPAD